MLEELFVRASFGDVALVEHQNLVGAFQGEEPLGNDKGGAPLHERVQRLLNEVFRFGVHTAGGIVQNEDARVGQQGAGDGHPLLLPAAQGYAALADHRLVPVGGAHDEVVGAGGFGGRDYIFHLGSGAAVGDIFGDGVAEQERILQDHANLAPQTLEGYVADVVVVNEDAAVAHFIKAGEQVGNRGFARTCRANESDGLPRLYHKINVAQNGTAAFVMKPDLFKTHFPLDVGQFLRHRLVGHFVGQIHNLEDAGGAGAGRGRQIDLEANPLHGAVEQQHIGNHGEEGADGNLGRQGHGAAPPQ